MQNIPLRRRIYVGFIVGCLSFYYRLYHRLQIEGSEHIPDHGPLFITINHISYLEPFALGVGLIEHGVMPGDHFWTVSKKELFAWPPLARFLSSINMFPIDRERTDMGAMRRILNVLREGKMIALAPEGTRSPSGRLQAFQPVIAKIAISRRIPILPVGAMGTEKALPVGAKFPYPVPITIRFGPVYELSEYYDVTLTDELADRASWEMRSHIAELLPEWMRELPPASGRVGARKA